MPNPDIALEGTRFFVPTEAHRFARGEARRFGAISSFGIGGTNAHAVLEEAPARAPEVVARERPRHLLALSAKSPEALAALAGRFAAHLSAAAPGALADACFTANVARSHFDHRLAVEAGSAAEMGERLAAFAAGRDVAAVSSGAIERGRSPRSRSCSRGKARSTRAWAESSTRISPSFARRSTAATKCSAPSSVARCSR